MKKRCKRFYLLVLLINFIYINNAAESFKAKSDVLYDALTDLYEREHNKLLEMLDEPNVNNFSKKSLGEALTRAAHYSDLDVVKGFLKIGADVNYADNFGYTALIHAAENNKTSVIKALIKEGADPNRVNCVGLTALLIAVEKGNIAMVKEFLQIPGIHVDSKILMEAKRQGGRMLEMFKPFMKS